MVCFVFLNEIDGDGGKNEKEGRMNNSTVLYKQGQCVHFCAHEAKGFLLKTRFLGFL